MLVSTDFYQRILSFPIDDGASLFSFEARLAHENGWSTEFAHRVVVEYRRFVFLAMIGDHPVTPSDEVDQAWHLHLTYSRSYWQSWCGDLLGRPLHHNPTRGGAAEAARYRQQYRQTLATYRQTFGNEPPTDIWPSVEVRFGADLHFVRVNTQRNLVISKAALRRTALGAAVLLAIVCATGCGGAVPNPFDLPGVAFFKVLIPMMVAAILLGRLLRYLACTPGPQPGDDEVPLDWADVAYLSGGAERLTTAGLARLVALGAVRVSADGQTLEPTGHRTAAGLSLVESTVLRALPLGRDQQADLASLSERVDAGYTAQKTHLREDGYLMPLSRVVWARSLGVLPLLAVLVFLAVPRFVLAILAARPVGFLLFFMLAMAISVVSVVLAASAPRDRQSRRTRGILKRLRKAHPQAQVGTMPLAETGLLVGLWGTAVLASLSDAPLLALTNWYPRPTTSASGGCGAGCGGGCGGCGGGCGGCGG